MYDTKLSIIIVNYNVKYFLEQCLHSVHAALSGMDAEVFVVDNHSTDGSVDYLRPKFPEVIFIENKDNPGFSKANNQAIRQCKGEYVLLLNPDTVIGEDCLRTLCYFMDGHPAAGAVGVKMINGHGLFLPESKRSFPSPWVSFCKMFGLSKLFPYSRRFARYNLLYLGENKQHKVNVLSGAFMFLRHEALDKVGLFDENFFMYGEDIDLSYRMVLGGYKNYYIPERILHYKGEATKHNDIKYIKTFYGAMLIFFRKYYPNSGKMTQFFIKQAISMKTLQNRLLEHKKTKKEKKTRQRRLLILSGEKSFDQLKTLAQQALPEIEDVNSWNIDQERMMDAFSRRNQMKQRNTDFLFCYPDVRFEQMLLAMDKMQDKTVTYHVYNTKSGCIVSPGK